MLSLSHSLHLDSFLVPVFRKVMMTAFTNDDNTEFDSRISGRLEFREVKSHLGWEARFFRAAKHRFEQRSR